MLVELGADGARTGARDEATAREIAERVAASGVLELRGAAGYEGALAHDRSPEALEAVSTYCRRLAAFAESLRPLIDATPWVSAGGSAYFDLVADAFAPLTDMRAILRSGAYIVHDSGFYRGISPLDTTRDVAEEQALLPGMRAYARVVSLPEPGLVLLDAGKRDVPYDEGLPTPLGVSATLGGPEHRWTGDHGAERSARLPAPRRHGELAIGDGHAGAVPPARRSTSGGDPGGRCRHGDGAQAVEPLLTHRPPPRQHQHQPLPPFPQRHTSHCPSPPSTSTSTSENELLVACVGSTVIAW